MINKGGLTAADSADGMQDEERSRAMEISGRYVHFTLSRKGPFRKTKDGPRKSKMMDLACELFPRGPPKDGEEWMRLGGIGASKFSEFAEFLFGRSAPTPLSMFLKFAHCGFLRYRVFSCSEVIS